MRLKELRREILYGNCLEPQTRPRLVYQKDYDLFLISGKNTELKAVPAGTYIFQQALKWLCPSEEIELSNISDTQVWLKMFLEKPNQMDFPNATAAKLMEFIEKRNWTGDHLWGYSKVQFLQFINTIKYKQPKWNLLCWFTSFNMAWQTKLI